MRCFSFLSFEEGVESSLDSPIIVLYAVELVSDLDQGVEHRLGECAEKNGKPNKICAVLLSLAVLQERQNYFFQANEGQKLREQMRSLPAASRKCRQSFQIRS